MPTVKVPGLNPTSTVAGNIGVRSGVWNSYIGKIRVTQANADPTGVGLGAWNRGDICWNDTPSAAGTPGWVCVTAGSPGTWKAMAVLAA